MSFEAEFSTVDVLLASNAETRGVDAFALTLIKAERQLRRVFTFLIYQQPAFRHEHVPALRHALALTLCILSRSPLSLGKSTAACTEDSRRHAAIETKAR